MKIPHGPGAAIFAFGVGFIAVASVNIHEYITNPFMSNTKITFSVLICVFCIWAIRSSTSDYKKELAYSKRCTAKDFADIKFLGIESRQGSNTNNTILLILEFRGVEKRFSGIEEEARIKYHKADRFPIFYNPTNPKEFVYDNLEFQEAS